MRGYRAGEAEYRFVEYTFTRENFVKSDARGLVRLSNTLEREDRMGEQQNEAQKALADETPVPPPVPDAPSSAGSNVPERVFPLIVPVVSAPAQAAMRTSGGRGRVPGWLVSFSLHLLVLIGLAAVAIDPPPMPVPTVT